VSCMSVARREKEKRGCECPALFAMYECGESGKVKSAKVGALLGEVRLEKGCKVLCSQTSIAARKATKVRRTRSMG
jgi:hypothetical protein